MERILVYALSENMGGVEEYVLNLSRFKSSKSHKYGYILLGNHSPYEKEMQNKHISYYKIPKKNHILRNIIKTYRLFKSLRNKYDVLYINTSSLGYILPYLIAYFMGYKLVLHSHLDARPTSSKFKVIVHKLNYRILRNKISGRLTCSTPAAKWMFDGDASEAILIPNAINLDKFAFNFKDRMYYRKKLGLENDKVIGNVGRLTYLKNQRFLINILSQFDDPRVKLLLVGDGEDKSELEKYVHELNLESRVIFYGRTNTPEKIMNVMDCIVMPSIAEGFPVTLVEAQAAGLPCVVSNIITQEIDATNTIEFLSLSESITKWKQSISKKLNHTYRYNNINKLRSKNFDVIDLEKKVYRFLK